ncbi:uncharacterized protein G2W53_007252 [Senna tora]|uniref:Uncharacterized protein n=1 Tax=Senna tora TaxID=362788 RepID=A0A835CFH7_9FABA|nr:uncharacterized protein G2W53_007252 [Senna tora]
MFCAAAMVVAEERRSSRQFCEHHPQKQASKSFFYLLCLVRFALCGAFIFSISLSIFLITGPMVFLRFGVVWNL